MHIYIYSHTIHIYITFTYTLMIISYEASPNISSLPDIILNNFNNINQMCFSTGNMVEEQPDTIGSLPRTASASSADPSLEPNPLGDMERQEAEVATKRRRSSEEDPLVAGWPEVVAKIDRGHDILAQLVTRLGEATRERTPRELYMQYLTGVMQGCSEYHWQLFRDTTSALITQNGGFTQPHSVAPTATTSQAHTYSVPSTFTAPSHLPVMPAVTVEETLAELTTPATTPSTTMAYIRSSLNLSWDGQDPRPGPSGV